MGNVLWGLRWGLLGLLGMSACALAAEIPVIGLGADGQEVVRPVPREVFFQAIHQAVTDTQDSVMPELACTKTTGKWKLDTFGVGIGISATAGVGPVYNVQAASKILLLFSRSREPVFP